MSTERLTTNLLVIMLLASGLARYAHAHLNPYRSIDIQNIPTRQSANTFQNIKKGQLPKGVISYQLVTVTNDRDNHVQTISIFTDANGVFQGFTLQDNMNKDGVTTRIFWLKDIESPNGVILAKDHNALKLASRGPFYDARQQGSFVINYLGNGLIGSYKSCHFTLKHDEKHSWHIENDYNQSVVRNIFIKTWFLGIDTLQNLCPEKFSLKEDQNP